MNACKRILLALLVFVLAGCVNIRVLPTPTPTLIVPTLTVTPSNTPTATLTPIPPTKTLTPSFTPEIYSITIAPPITMRAVTAVPVSIIPPPAQTINLKDVDSVASGLSSYQASISVQTATGTTYLEETRTYEPDSRYLRVFDQGAILAHCVRIGKREWVGVGTDPIWISGNAATEGQALCTYTLAVMMGAIGNALPDQQAKLTEPSQNVGGILCNKYSWASKEATGSVCIAIPDGKPVHAEWNSTETKGEVRFSHFNDPSNVIKAPTSKLPNQLHIDDARMALNGLASFQWTLSRTGKLGSQSTDMYVKGTYVQTTQAWQVVSWNNTEMKGTPTKFLVMGDKYWVDLLDTKQWSPISKYPQLQGGAVDGLGPFSEWHLGGIGNIAQEGVLAAQKSRNINGIWCDEYTFKADWKNKDGVALTANAHLFVVPATALPIRMEVMYAGADGSAMRSVMELSNLNDPANKVETPP